MRRSMWVVGCVLWSLRWSSGAGVGVGCVCVVLIGLLWCVIIVSAYEFDE